MRLRWHNQRRQQPRLNVRLESRIRLHGLVEFSRLGKVENAATVLEEVLLPHFVVVQLLYAFTIWGGGVDGRWCTVS